MPGNQLQQLRGILMATTVPNAMASAYMLVILTLSRKPNAAAVL
jgi:hypothetical protein